MATSAGVLPSELNHRCDVSVNVICLAALGDSTVALSSIEGLQVISLDGSQPVCYPSFVAECLVALGSQTLAGGNDAGYVCVWHWRRKTLKQVLRVPVHQNGAAVRCLANGGDVVLTASDDGTLRQLNVLEDWAQSDFLPPVGAPLLCVAFCGRRAVLAGCEDGRVLEVSRRKAEVMRQMNLGCPVRTLDCDDDDTGGRVVATGDGCVAVWVRRKQAPGNSCDVEVADAKWSIPDVSGAFVLQGSRRLEDIVVASASGLSLGAAPWPHEKEETVALLRRRASCLARGGKQGSFFMVVPTCDKPGSKQQKQQQPAQQQLQQKLQLHWPISQPEHDFAVALFARPPFGKKENGESSLAAIVEMELPKPPENGASSSEAKEEGSGLRRQPSGSAIVAHAAAGSAASGQRRPSLTSPHASALTTATGPQISSLATPHASLGTISSGQVPSSSSPNVCEGVLRPSTPSGMAGLPRGGDGSSSTPLHPQMRTSHALSSAAMLSLRGGSGDVAPSSNRIGAEQVADTPDKVSRKNTQYWDPTQASLAKMVGSLSGSESSLAKAVGNPSSN